MNFALGYYILVLKCRLGHGKMRTIYGDGGIISKKNKKHKTYDFFCIFSESLAFIWILRLKKKFATSSVDSFEYCNHQCIFSP